MFDENYLKISIYSHLDFWEAYRRAKNSVSLVKSPLTLLISLKFGNHSSNCNISRFYPSVFLPFFFANYFLTFVLDGISSLNKSTCFLFLFALLALPCIVWTQTAAILFFCGLLFIFSPLHWSTDGWTFLVSKPIICF